MAENNINAYCRICGEGYHVCNTCKEQKTFKAWRSVTDTPGHFLIYSALHQYTISKDKNAAKEELQKCDLTGLENFKPEIKSVIREIMDTPKDEARGKNASIRRKENAKIDEGETSEENVE